MTTANPPGLRERARSALKDSLGDIALELFEERGFDEVTVNDVAAAAGISPRSFFRYFPTKEDVVFGTRMPDAGLVRDELRRHLTDGTSGWQALHATFRSAVGRMEADAVTWKRVLRVINRTAGLRARNLDKHLAWAAALVPEITASLGGDTELLAQTMVATALTCFDIALTQWADGAEGTSLGALIDEVFDYIDIPAIPR
jgi:AcrR family transcriptional regulator